MGLVAARWWPLLISDLETNALLEALERSAKAQFLPRFQHVELRRGDVLHNQGQAVDRIYFPLRGLVAIMSETLAGESVQTGMIGCDGLVGAAEAVGSSQHLCRAVVQIPGDALRLSASSYRDLLHAAPGFRSAAERFLEMQLLEARQLTACNALHGVEGRLCRALVEVLDRSCLDRILPLTQEALAQMLGAQRTTVAVFLSKLQRKGLIKNRRGAIEVRDEAGVQRLACSCLETLQFMREEVRFLQAPPQRDVG